MKRRIVIFSFIILAGFSSCHVGRFFIYNFAGVNDYKKFPTVPVHNDPEHVFKFSVSSQPLNFDTFPMPTGFSDEANTIGQYHEETKTTAFLIIRNDTILYENYFGGNEDKILTSFSVSKSFIGALIGIAVDDGLIENPANPMTDFIDYWDNDSAFSKISVNHLLDMRSGIMYDENYYNPFGDVAKFYYGRQLEKYLADIELKPEIPEEYDYVSVNTLLLSLILEKVSGITTAQYLENKLWKPLGMEFDATLSLDRKDGTIKAFAGLNARLRDFAKLGRLYLNWGNWEGKQIISKSWIERLRNKRPANGRLLAYADQWWIGRYGDFSAIGFLGQYIYVFPEKNIIIVRTGKKSENWLRLLQFISSEVL